MSEGFPVAALAEILTDLRAATQALATLAQAVAQGARFPAQSPPSLPQPIQESPALVDVVNQLLVAKARAQRSDAWLRALRCSLSSFAQTRGRRPIATISTEDVEDWAHGHGWGPRTVKNRLAHLQELFRFAITRGYCQASPVASVERPAKAPAPVPALHTPDQVKAVLEAARRADPDACRHLALRYFCGLRTSEALRLEECHIGARFVEVPGWASKTRSRRLVDIPDNLRAWLALPGRLPMTNEKRARRVAQSAGIAWPHNVARHSWCSYHLALHESAARTALQAGHSEAMLFRHYRALASPDQAREFFQIRPDH